MTSAPSLTRDQILGKVDRALVKIDVPEWGGVVYARPIGLAGSMAIYNGSKADEKDEAGASQRRAALLLVHGTCDENGKLLFTEADVAALMEKHAGPCSRILEKINATLEEAGPEAVKN